MDTEQRLHKTIDQLRRWDTETLQELDSELHSLLTERQQQETAPLPVRAGRTVVAERQEGRTTLRQEFVRCGKAGCHCATDQGHGPYWYAYVRKAGRLTSAYIGKDLERWTRETSTAASSPAALQTDPVSDQDALREAIAAVGQGRVSFIRIHRARAALGWSRDRFDRALEDARQAQSLELLGGDPAQLTAEELAASYSDALGQYLTLSWITRPPGQEPRLSR